MNVNELLKALSDVIGFFVFLLILGNVPYDKSSGLLSSFSINMAHMITLN